ncbi:MAG TPA: hypothetical protein VGG20_02690 [Thermoanaerobaculia bacterium]
MTALDLPAYLARIHDQGPLEPTAETLRPLHLAHLLTQHLEEHALSCCTARFGILPL